MYKVVIFTCVGFFILSLSACGQDTKSELENKETVRLVNKLDQDATLSVATFAGGCFWCTETIFESIIGVKEVVSGYAGGDDQNPTYYQVGGGNTSHAEAFQVYYDTTIISYTDLVNVFFASIDPTIVN